MPRRGASPCDPSRKCSFQGHLDLDLKNRDSNGIRPNEKAHRIPMDKLAASPCSFTTPRGSKHRSVPTGCDTRPQGFQVMLDNTRAASKSKAPRTLPRGHSSHAMKTMLLIIFTLACVKAATDPDSNILDPSKGS